MHNVSPIFWNVKQSFSLSLVQQFQETMKISPTEDISVESFTEVELFVDLSVMIYTDFYLENCQINSVIRIAEEIEKYPNILYIAKVKVIHFDNEPVILKKGEAMLSFNIYNDIKEFKLINVPKLCFEGMYNDLMSNKKLNYVQFLAGKLSKQLLNYNQTTQSIEIKIIECNTSLLNDPSSKKIQNYK